MHLLKSALSAVLLLVSIFWLGIQHIFLSPDILEKLFSPIPRQAFDIFHLKKDWCRVKSKQISWREILGSCQKSDYFMKDKRFATNAQLSQVTQIKVRGAGEHTLLRIVTYTRFGIAKTFGGDSFRISFRGDQVITATVFDLKNGSYDALALITKPGRYKIQIILDYTQCDGIKDPPTEWYVKAHCGKQKIGDSKAEIVGRHIQSRMLDYINEEISPGINIEVPPARYDLNLLPYILDQMNCGFQCQQVWDGHGAWNKYIDKLTNEKQWVWEETRPQRFNRKGLTHRNKSTLWIYGDSISYYLYKRIQSTGLCHKTFQRCNNTYNWIYPKTLYELRHFCSDIDVDKEKIRQFFKEVINTNEMDSRSVLIFNLGAHFVKNTSFRKYRDILNVLMNELTINYKGTVIWKSTTAIHHQNIEVMGAFRRYLTNHRVELFNAYANSMICASDMALLDVYPMTSSFPYGTKDGVHYHKNASAPMEKMLMKYFKYSSW